MRNLKYSIIAISWIFSKTFLFSQVLYDKNGIKLSYSTTYFNTVSIEKTNFYDQYEIKVSFANNSGNAVFSPTATIEWERNLELKAVSKFFWKKGLDGYKEYKYKYIKDSLPQSANQLSFNFPDGRLVWYKQPFPYDPNEMFPKAPKTESLMLDGQTDICTIYYLVEHNQPLPTPKWSLQDIVPKKNFKKENVSLYSKECSCFDKNKPRGKKGDLPKGLKSPVLNSQCASTIKNTEVRKETEKEIEKPLRSIQELKTLILRNLQNNTKNFTGTIEMAGGTSTFNFVIKRFEVVGDELHYYSSTQNIFKNDGVEASWNLIPHQFKTVVNLKESAGATNGYKSNKQDPKSIWIYESKTFLVNKSEMIADCKSKNVMTTQYENEKFIYQAYIFNYDKGYMDKNFVELDNAIKDLKKQLKK